MINKSLRNIFIILGAAGTIFCTAATGPRISESQTIVGENGGRISTRTTDLASLEYGDDVSNFELVTSLENSSGILVAIAGRESDFALSSDNCSQSSSIERKDIFAISKGNETKILLLEKIYGAYEFKTSDGKFLSIDENDNESLCYKTNDNYIQTLFSLKFDNEKALIYSEKCSSKRLVFDARIEERKFKFIDEKHLYPWFENVTLYTKAVSDEIRTFSLNETSVNIISGDSTFLVPSSNGTIIWESSNPNYVQVSNGVVTTKKGYIGKAVITANYISSKGNSLKASCAVNVVSASRTSDVESVSTVIDSTSFQKLNNSNAGVFTKNGITFKYENIISTVSETGKSSGIGFFTEGGAASISCVSTNLGSKTIGRMYLKSYFDQPFSGRVTYVTNGQRKVMTVNSNSLFEFGGVITEFKLEGLNSRNSARVLSEIILIPITRGVTAATSIAFANPKVCLDINSEGYQLKFGIAPSNTNIDRHDLIWSSANEYVATVDKNGIVHPIAHGKTTITATSRINNCQAICEIMVNTKESIKKADCTILVYTGALDFEQVDETKKSSDWAAKNLSDLAMGVNDASNVNVVAQTGGQEYFNSKSETFLSPLTNEYDQRWHLDNGKYTLVQTLKNYLEISGNVKPLHASTEYFKNFLLWGMTYYPAEDYAVILDGHGGNNLGRPYLHLENKNYLKYYDVVNVRDERLYVSDACKAIDEVLTDIGIAKKLNFLSYDACGLANLETIYESSKVADYIYASETDSSTARFNYYAFGQKIVHYKKMNNELAKELTDGMTNYSLYTKDGKTMYERNSIFDSKEFDSFSLPFIELCETLYEASANLTGYSSQETAEKVTITSIVKDGNNSGNLTFKGNNRGYCDLLYFLEEIKSEEHSILLQKIPNLIELVEKVINHLERIFVAKNHDCDEKLQNAYGLSVYYHETSSHSFINPVLAWENVTSHF